ncbi:MATH and LRR domain-containing protein PFE0570w-like [Melitaea cinxia]|uniref:MATH and LRR domain-containing protein PFE0570w-like n=1 Tax=Melitaea cinxia TaxID=113334 RepID=UPI001E27275D|nr:MATH and LRR domain-containing protein PFE0570w-like [Melitaea cinxia]
MASSDDSFAWSDASKDSDDMDVNKKDETEESGISYKKSLQEKLFKDEEQEPKKKSKKRKHEETATINESEEEKPKPIKSESESDFDAPKKKKKKKSKDDSNINESQQSNNSDDSYLNYLVKQEQTSFAEPAPVKSKKKKRHKRDSEMVTSEELDNHNHDKSTDKNDIENGVKEEIESKKKKNKKSKHEANTSTDDFEPSDDNLKPKKKLKKKKQENIINSTSYDKSEIPQISQIEDISAIDSSTLVNNYLDDDQSKVNVDENDMSQEIESNTSTCPDTSSSNKVKKSHTIADRLRFEEEDSVDYTLKENVDDTKLSKNLKKFIESNSNLSIVKASAEKGTMLTPNDEIWIIKAPHDLNVQDFAGINMKIGGRNKLKINGQTYDLVSDDSIEKAPILMCDKNKIYIPHVPINSIINVQKRIPKAHIPEENVMVNYQPNFIPLPETKCRHPLFGVNYRKATKIAPSVAERLKDTVVSSPVNDERVKKKKHKKEKRKLELESESEMKPLDEEASVISSKKKRKRKSSIKEEPVTKKAKYVNNEDTGDVWESEQAIEKNLFDF